jgi:hypothetical protein
VLPRGTEKARQAAAQTLSEVMGAQELNYFG